MLDFLKSCLEIEASKRPTISDLLSHPIFDFSFKHDFEKEFGITPRAMPKKIKSKLFLTPTQTPEPTSYLRYYSRKKSPNYIMPNKHSDETLRLKKSSPSNLRVNEKPYFLPEISRREEHFSIKKSSKHIQKALEIKTEHKSTMKFSDPNFENSRKLSLVRENSIDNIVNSSFANPIHSNRGHVSVKKSSGVQTPEGLPDIYSYNNKYRVKKREEVKTTVARPVGQNFNNFSTFNGYK